MFYSKERVNISIVTPEVNTKAMSPASNDCLDIRK